MARNNILMWRPRAPKANAKASNYRLWSMHKQFARIDCEIRDCAEHGWSVVFHFNSQWFSSHRFATWAEAIAAADDKHAELERAGWTPVMNAQRFAP
jgi:hypothetical protein